MGRPQCWFWGDLCLQRKDPHAFLNVNVNLGIGKLITWMWYLKALIQKELVSISKFLSAPWRLVKMKIMATLLLRWPDAARTWSRCSTRQSDECFSWPQSQEPWELRMGVATMRFRGQRKLQGKDMARAGSGVMDPTESREDQGCSNDRHSLNTSCVPGAVLCLLNASSPLLLRTRDMLLFLCYRCKCWSSEICFRLITQIVGYEAEAGSEVDFSPKPLFLPTLLFEHQSPETQMRQTSQRKRTG